MWLAWYWVFGEVYGTSVIASYWDNSKINTVIPELMFHPDNLHATSIQENILYLNSE